MEDFGSTTAVVAYVRRRLTPAVAWSAIGTLGAALLVSITWIVTTQSDIHQLKEQGAETKKSTEELRQQLDLLHKIDTQLAVMSGKIDTVASEVDRLREWQERIEDVAESPPHAARKRR